MSQMYEPKIDCFGYPERADGPSCTALNTMLCATRGRCSFYKEREQAREEAGRARSLAIAKGYYLGNGKYEPRGGGERI